MSVDGKWNVTVNTPMGARPSTFVFEADGDTLNGHGETPDGDNQAIKNGKIDGDKLSWEYDITQPMPMTLEFDGAVDGDSMSGTTKAGAFGNMPFVGTRA